MNPQPYQISNLDHRELQSLKTGEKFSLSATISEIAGLKDIFVHHEIIPPGRRASSTHSHTQREEMIVVLEGIVTATICNQSFDLKPGEFLGFPPGQEHVHCVENKTDFPVKLLVIASNPAKDEEIYLE